MAPPRKPSPPIPPEGPRYTVLVLCRNRAGYEAAPERPLHLDLQDVERRVASAGATVQGNAGILLAVRFGRVDASIFESGKVLFKTRDLEAASEAMRTFYAAMGFGASPRPTPIEGGASWT